MIIIPTYETSLLGPALWQSAKGRWLLELHNTYHDYACIIVSWLLYECHTETVDIMILQCVLTGAGNALHATVCRSQDEGFVTVGPGFLTLLGVHHNVFAVSYYITKRWLTKAEFLARNAPVLQLNYFATTVSDSECILFV